MNKNLILLRGLPGAGKSSLSKLFKDAAHYEADMFFMKDGEYKFIGSKLRDAHAWCQMQVENAMIKEEPTIIVSNTFTREWEMEAYYKLAKKMNYRVFSLIVENRHEGENIHGVMKSSLKDMENRFEIKLM